MIRRILFVDDEPKILRAFERQLNSRFDMRTATGGALALETLRQDGPFAVVVSDLRMPELNGIQLLAKVRELSRIRSGSC